MNKFKLTSEYKRYHHEYAAKYPRVAILLQVGGFFELYADESDPVVHAAVTEIVSYINCELTIKDPRSDEKVYMGGFPLRSIEKNIARLVENDYTVVVIEQQGNLVPAGADKVPRKTTRVVSKGTISDSTRLRTNILSIYYRKYGKNLYTFGIAIIDTNISKEIIVHEIQSHPEDKGLSLDTARKFVQQYDPVECIIVTKFGDNPDDIIRHLGLSCNPIKRDIQMIDGDLLDQLKESNHVSSDAILYSLAMLKMFLRDHYCNLDITDSQILPFTPNEHLDLCSTAIKQLDLYAFFHRRDIMKTSTPMGKRLLMNRILNPIKNIQELNRRYDAIDSMDDNKSKTLRDALSRFPDLDKTHKKLGEGLLTWGQFKVLHECWQRAHRTLPEETSIGEMIDEYSKVLIFQGSEATTEQTMEENEEDEEEKVADKTITHLHIFKKGLYPDLDEVLSRLDTSKRFIRQFVEEASNVFSKPVTFKIKDKSGLETTELRAKSLKKDIPNLQSMKMPSNKVIVYTEELRNHLVISSNLEEQISRMMEVYFTDFQRNLFSKWEKLLCKISCMLAELDVQQASYVMKKQFRLTRPQLSNEHKLNMVGLRHLLIELINPDVRYVPNDCQLNEKGPGMLLYGVNSCGKTSYLKAVGVAVTFAQAGLFVPADSMEFSPFSRIMTRIAGTDNMERSQSSYIVELEELLSVVHRSNNQTLVLGDEMCRGTEVESANSMVYTVLKWLVERNTFFIAATHLHDIVPKIKENLSDKISIYHMKVSMTEDGDVIYDRSLTKGPGPRLYGLEIAKAMHFPATFLREAMNYRVNAKVEKEKSASGEPLVQSNNVTPEMPKIVRSRYNAKKILVKCESCGYRPDNSRCIPLDTHHIEFQCNADAEGFHGSQKKNVLHNLICLCKECHIKVHKGELVVKTIQTLKGSKYVVEEQHQDSANVHA